MANLRICGVSVLPTPPSRVGKRSSKLSFPATVGAIALFCAAAAIASPGQSVYLTTLATFDGSNGLWSFQPMVQGSDGNLYGTTIQEGPDGAAGTIFKIGRAGTLTTLYGFCSQPTCADGAGPFGGLTQATDGNLYGTTEGGGAYNEGTVYRVTFDGVLTSLYSFCASGDPCNDGFGPRGPLLEGADGNFYGTASAGGSLNCESGCGTVFKISPQGTLTTLYSFQGLDGGIPYDGLVQATDGDFYGTTYIGGPNSSCNAYNQGCGTIFRITPSGTLTTLYNFCSQPNCADGSFPIAGLVQARDGNLYGTTDGGGTHSGGVAFKITPAGAFTVLYNFDQMTGFEPDGTLVQGTDGDLYGTTLNGGAQGAGTAFKITTAGRLTTLHNFCAARDWPCSDGYSPEAGLVQARDGAFYGTTTAGGIGPGVWGTVFRLGVVHACATCRP